MIRRDPLLNSAAWLTGVAVLLLFVFSRSDNAQVQVFWAFQVPLDVLLAYSAWRVTRVATGPIRRFWRVLTISGSLFVIGDTTQAVTSMLSEGQWGTNGGTVQSTCFAVGLAMIVIAMLVHPHPHRSGRERLAFWLDSATVLVGGAVVAWVFTVGKDNAPAEDMVPRIAAGAVILTAAFASVKLILSGNAPMHKAAAFPMIGSAIFNGVGFFLAPEADGSLPAYVYAVRLLPSLLIAYGPRIQEIITGYDQTAFGSRKRKRYSLLPYGSIAVVFTSMIAVLRDGLQGDMGIRIWGVVVGLGAIVTLVAARQLVAFHDNTRLISELDDTLAELREHEIRLRHQAHYDGLTGLANRTYFHEQVAASLEDGEPGTVSLLLIDLDGFKAVNDTLGHAAGDTLLAGVADHLLASVRTGDVVARLGGDEFAVLLRDCDPPRAQQTAERILQNLEIPIAIGGDKIRAHASIGVAGAGGADDVESLLRAADLAMYAAKHHGKNCWRSYEPAMEAA
ncbi:GGDEF domain-containing protein [Actinoplanes sp. NPDC051861]|uniref:GGDEF domain-containing protein n=1 Tax=Actinoplanes sp. NPDC051861 TaxID=3155170 RepID=UPI003442FB36